GDVAVRGNQAEITGVVVVAPAATLPACGRTARLHGVILLRRRYGVDDGHKCVGSILTGSESGSAASLRRGTSGRRHNRRLAPGEPGQGGGANTRESQWKAAEHCSGKPRVRQPLASIIPLSCVLRTRKNAVMPQPVDYPRGTGPPGMKHATPGKPPQLMVRVSNNDAAERLLEHVQA